MKVFVTGGAGYIGSAVTELLLDSGHDVVVFDNLSTGHRAAVDPRATFVCGDTADAAGVAEAMASADPDVVVHMAAYIRMGESMHDPGKYFRNNTANACMLWMPCSRPRCRTWCFHPPPAFTARRNRCQLKRTIR